MSKETSSVLKKIELLGLIITIVLSGYGVWSISKAWWSGIYRHMYVSPERISSTQFSEKSRTILEQIRSFQSFAGNSDSSWCSLARASDALLNDSSLSFGVWVLCAESGASLDSFEVTLQFQDKDLKGWKFLPEENFAQTMKEAKRAEESDRLKFSVKALRPGKPVGVAILQENATLGPTSITFDPPVSGVIPAFASPPFWYGKARYCLLFLMGFTLAWYIHRLTPILKLRILEWLTR